MRLCTELASKMIEERTRVGSAGARRHGLGNAVIDWESDRRQQCSTRTDARVRLLRQESRSECREGRGWGHSGSTLWVDRGCRGLFEVSPRAASGGGDLTQRAVAACRSKVAQQGFSYRKTGTVRNVGRHIEVDVTASRGSVEINLRCRFDPVFGTVDLASY